MSLRKLLQVIIILAITLQIGLVAVYAQEGNTDTSDNNLLEEQLLLQIPDVTDNPNFTLTFKPPTGDGVELKIDGGEFKKIKNPYTLPTLGVGRHTLVFKFKDKEEAAREVETQIVVVPRAPQINPPEEISNNKLTLTGTSLPTSEIRIFMTGNAQSYEAIATADNAGEWVHVFEEEFENTVYSIVTISSKNGFGSTFSEPLNFTIGDPIDEDGKNIKVEEKLPIAFSLSDLSRDNIGEIIDNNPDLIILVSGLLVFGILLGLLINWLFNSNQEKKSVRQFSKLLSSKAKTDSNPDQAEPMLKADESGGIRSKLQAAGLKGRFNRQTPETTSTDEEEPIEDQAEDVAVDSEPELKKADEEKPEDPEKDDIKEKASPKKIEEKELSKEEFLAKFKEHDPDPESKIATTPKDDEPLTSKIIATPDTDKENEPKKEKKPAPKKAKPTPGKPTEEDTTPPKNKKIKLSLTSGSLSE